MTEEQLARFEAAAERFSDAVIQLEAVVDRLGDAARVCDTAGVAMGSAANGMREAAGTMMMARR